MFTIMYSFFVVSVYIYVNKECSKAKKIILCCFFRWKKYNYIFPKKKTFYLKENNTFSKSFSTSGEQHIKILLLEK